MDDKVAPDTTGRRHITVAIVGTGLAGLTVAHLLQKDRDERYQVTLFEQANCLSFDAASVAVRNETTGSTERIDLPMRACAGGYYANLIRMYQYLGISFHPLRFLFVFAQALPGYPRQGRWSEAMKPQDAGTAPGSYFVHASNLHQMPPPKPTGSAFFPYLFEVLYLVLCHAWFSIICFFVPPVSASQASQPALNGACEGRATVDSEIETVDQYLRRTWLPRRYISHYLLPLMSSVSTCSHAEFLAFPASDLVRYKALSHGQQHYAVCGGIGQVQSKLILGVQDVRLGSRVTEIISGHADEGLTVRWQSKKDENGANSEKRFDRVILAVSPDVVARIFRPLAAVLNRVPTVRVESWVKSARPGSHSIVSDSDGAASRRCAHHDMENDTWRRAQVITLRTAFHGCDTRTEAIHAMPSGVIVSTCPTDTSVNAKETLRTAIFTRTLRTAGSRNIVNRLMGLSLAKEREKKIEDQGDAKWENGMDGVWLVGSWCWDGMVLLEGCVVSAMRVARDFGVEIPWQAR